MQKQMLSLEDEIQRQSEVIQRTKSAALDIRVKKGERLIQLLRNEVSFECCRFQQHCRKLYVGAGESFRGSES